MKIHVHKLFIGSLLLFLHGCIAFNQQTRQPVKKLDNTPEWTRKTPINSEYFTTVIRVSKSIFPTDYLEVARKEALVKLNSEVVLKVHPQSLMHKISSSNSQITNFQHIYTLKEEDFSGIHLAKNFENENEYWGLYQIKKIDHQNNQKEQHTMALQEAKDWFIKAKNAEKRGYVFLALNYYLESLWKLERFIHLPNKVTYQNNEILIDVECIDNFQALINQVSIQTPRNSILTTSTFAVRTMYQQKPISKLPIVTVLPNKIEEVNTSDYKGIVAQEYLSNGEYQWKISLKTLLENYNDNTPLYKAILKLTVPSYQKHIELKKTKISIQNTPSQLQFVLIKEFKKQHFAPELKPHELQCIIKVDEYFEENEQGLILCKLIGSFVVKKRTQIIFEEHLSPVLGIHSDKNGARDKAYESFPEKIIQTTLPNFFKSQK